MLLYIISNILCYYILYYIYYIIILNIYIYVIIHNIYIRIYSIHILIYTYIYIYILCYICIIVYIYIKYYISLYIIIFIYIYIYRQNDFQHMDEQKLLGTSWDFSEILGIFGSLALAFSFTYFRIWAMDSSSKTSSRNAMTGRFTGRWFNSWWLADTLHIAEWSGEAICMAPMIFIIQVFYGILYSVVTIETCPKACPMPTSKKC